ncbi:hypothetical protein D3C72_1838170 [compost metagenome]
MLEVGVRVQKRTDEFIEDAFDQEFVLQEVLERTVIEIPDHHDAGLLRTDGHDRSNDFPQTRNFRRQFLPTAESVQHRLGVGATVFPLISGF